MKPRRIALVARRFDPAGGGTERDLIITAQQLARRGHQIRIYALETRGRSADFDVTRIGVPAAGRSLRLLAFAMRAAGCARRDGAELVLSFGRIIGAEILRSGGSAHLSFLRTSRQWRTPLERVTARISPYHRVQMLIEARGYRSPLLKKAIAVSELVRSDLIRTFSLDPRDTVTLYNGVDLERFQPPSPARRDEVRGELRLRRDEAVVLFVGNGFARKGLGFLIDAMTRAPANARLMIAGADRAAQRYWQQAEALGRRVNFLGPAAQVDRLLAAADILALPSLFEPFGNVALEAMAAGVPALCSRACGAAEILPPALIPFIISDPANSEEIASCLTRLLDVAGALRSLSRVTAERFTWQDYGRRLLEIIAAI